MTGDSDETTFIADSHRYDDEGAYESYRGNVYQRDDEKDSADEVDPKKLVRTPTQDDVRWYYRNGPMASTIVDKPVDDAFKHGFSLNEESEDKREFLDDIVDDYKEAHRKARRDGFALLWFRLRDTAPSWAPPQNVQGLHEVKVLTLDDMSRAKPIAFEEKLSAGNQDAILESENEPSITEMQTMRDLVRLGENGRLTTDGDANRLPRQSDDPTSLAVDQHDIEIGGGDVSPNEFDLRYGRSRFYYTSDSGIVFSKRLDSERFEKPIGYLYDRGTGFNPLMIHPSRIYHVTWRGDVDGDIDDDSASGGYEGDSVLRPIIHILRAVHKANWAVAQKLFRHSAPLHVMNYEEGVDEGEISQADRTIRNINAKSSIMEPPGFELRTVESDSEAEIGDSFDVLFDQLCAGTEFTRSVLFGTQAGTVSGSETDIKNYFNQVERLREDRFTDELTEIVNWYSDFDAEDYSFDTGLNIDWGPLFRLTALDRAEAMARHVQLVTQAATNYILTPDEAKSLLAEQWADWTDIEMGDEAPLDVEDIQQLDLESTDMGGNPRVGQNGGGNEGLEDTDEPTAQ